MTTTAATAAEPKINGDKPYDGGDTPTADDIIRQAPMHAISDDKAVRLRALERWLRRYFEESLVDTLTKANAYGTGDIEILAASISALLPMQDVDYSVEAAIAFYCAGKLARILGAMQDGQSPGADSWHDLRVYATMGEKIRNTGRWM